MQNVKTRLEVTLQELYFQTWMIWKQIREQKRSFDDTIFNNKAHDFTHHATLQLCLDDLL